MQSRRAGWTILSTMELTGDHSMSGEFHEPLSSMLDGPYWSLNAAYPVLVSLWLCLNVFTSQSRHNLRRVAMSLTDFLLMCQSITSPCSKSLSSPDLSMLMVLLNNENTQLSASFYTGKCGCSDN
jgi:hypothetical protein